MKSIRILLLLIIVILCESEIVSAQETDNTTTLFDYELVSSSELKTGLDTMYTVIFSIDTLDLNKYTRVTVIGENKEKLFSVKQEDIVNDQRFILLGDKYIFNGGEWAGETQWLVKAKKQDGSEDILKSKKKLDKVKHKVIEESKPRDLKLNTNQTLNKEEK